MCRVCGIELEENINWYSSYKTSYSNICIECEKKRQQNPKYKETTRLYNLEHKEENSERYKEYYLNNKEVINERNREWYLENQEEILEKERERRSIRRHIIISHYSKGTMKCMCPDCNEDHYDFLTIDHVNNDGAKHREEIGVGGSNLYGWLIVNDFPEGFQVLCMNCNFSKGKHGYCSKHQV